MPSSAGPIEMLRKCRAHFVERRSDEHLAALAAKTVAERDSAVDRRGKAEKFISSIDATLRDWE